MTDIFAIAKSPYKCLPSFGKVRPPVKSTEFVSVGVQYSTNCRARMPKIACFQEIHKTADDALIGIEAGPVAEIASQYFEI